MKLNLKDFGVKANAKWHRWHNQIDILHLESALCIKGILESKESSLLSARITLLAKTYEWLFEFIIPRSVVECTKGLADAYIKFKLQATVRRGRLSNNYYAFKLV
jgi:hypothetical protein